MTHRRGLPHVPVMRDQERQRFLQAVRDDLEMARSTTPQRFVSVDMLVKAGIVTAEQAKKLASM